MFYNGTLLINQQNIDIRISKEKNMRLSSITKIFSATMIVLIMTGCGEDFLDTVNDKEPNSVPGGTANAPAEMSLDLHNVVKKNSYYNYFKYAAEEDEKLTIQAILDNAILSTQRTDCQQNGESYIAVYDSKMNRLDGIRTCTKYLRVEFPTEDTYVFQIQYPGNKGYFTADSNRR